MGNSYIGETILIRTALKLRRLTSKGGKTKCVKTYW